MNNDMEEVRSRFANQRTNQASPAPVRYREGEILVNQVAQPVGEIAQILDHLRQAGLGAAIAGLEQPWLRLHESLMSVYGMLHRADEVAAERAQLSDQVRGARNVVDLYEGARWRLDIQDEPLAEVIMKLVQAANNHKRDAENIESIYAGQAKALKDVQTRARLLELYVEELEKALEATAGRKVGQSGPARQKRTAQQRATARQLQEQLDADAAEDL